MELPASDPSTKSARPGFGGVARSLSASFRASSQTLPLDRIPVRAVAVVVAVALAYNYSLQTLLRGLDLQTPLAYLALVPPIAVLLGAANLRLQPVLPAIHDRQVDWILGLLLIGVAAVFTVLLPSGYSADYWLHRLDMLGLPFFAAGVVTLVYGVRRLWAMRWAIAFLFLAWPDPYVSVLASAIGSSTDLALAVVGASLVFLPFAHSLGNGTFLIDNASGPFSLAVGSACSGINSLVGFLILGAALNTIFRGRILSRLAWLAAGLVVVGLLNVVRIDLIFVAGWVLGESFAIDVLHPVAGIIVFGVGALAMLGIAPLFGLRVPVAPSTGASEPVVTFHRPGMREPAAPRPPLRPKPLPQVRKPAAAVVASLIFGAALAIPNMASRTTTRS